MSTKVLILGSSGFVGKNLSEELSKENEVVQTFRNKQLLKSNEAILFDFELRETWDIIAALKPDFIINAAAYGVVKTETDLQKMYQINYFLPRELYNYLKPKLNKTFWIQIGTAFEYDLNTTKINEKSPCLPQTHYGISKLMFSNYLLNYAINNYIVLRPFAMFGKYEDETKIIPYLIKAQKGKIKIKLSEGYQKRDYLYVRDFVNFIAQSIIKAEEKLPTVMNVGSGQPIALRDLAKTLSKQLEVFDAALWGWGEIPYRSGESDIFYSDSQLAGKYGLKCTPVDQSLKEVVNYY